MTAQYLKYIYLLLLRYLLDSIASTKVQALDGVNIRQLEYLIHRTGFKEVVSYPIWPIIISSRSDLIVLDSKSDTIVSLVII